MTAEEIACVCHEANRAITFLVEDVPMQPPWGNIDADMRASAIKGVEFMLEHPSATAEELHEAWCKERWSQGWVLGENKNTEAKTHPALRPYAELALGTRQKDAVFRAIVRELR